MSTFQVGEVAIVAWNGNSRMNGRYVGEEVLVVSLEPHCRCSKCKCRIRTSDGNEYDCGFDQLRKKKPPEQLSSWDAIQEITRWHPNGATA